MKIGIRYWQRLGDVIRLFPLAEHFNRQGHEVKIICSPIYHEIFRCASYVEPGTLDEDFDRLIDLEIWDSFADNNNQPRYMAFRTMKKKWVDFIYDDFPEVENRYKILFTKIEFEDYFYEIPEQYNLIAPMGMSQIFKWPFPEIQKRVYEIMDSTHDLNPTYVLGTKDVPGVLTAKKLYHLPKMIKDAASFFCINSAPSIIAGAVRENKYYHFDGS